MCKASIILEKRHPKLVAKYNYDMLDGLMTSYISSSKQAGSWV